MKRFSIITFLLLKLDLQVSHPSPDSSSLGRQKLRPVTPETTILFPQIGNAVASNTNTSRPLPSKQAQQHFQHCQHSNHSQIHLQSSSLSQRLCRGLSSGPNQLTIHRLHSLFGLPLSHLSNTHPSSNTDSIFPQYVFYIKHK